MSSNPNSALDRFTTFSQEIDALSALRKSRRSAIKKYPSVSVVVSTLRANDLSNLLDQLLKQTLKTFDLILGLHTIELSQSHKKQIAALKRRGVSVIVEKYTSDKTLGMILTSLASQSHSDFIAKMDDDDYYGPEHLRDLVDAALDTGADVVGRAMNYVYLEPLQLTVRRFAPHGTQAVELWSDWVCGGTILAKLKVAKAAGWFGDGNTAVDRYLLTNVTNNGGKIWRTFGAGYIYRRTFTFHTYVTNYSKYLQGANEQKVGIWNHPIFGDKR